MKLRRVIAIFILTLLIGTAAFGGEVIRVIKETKVETYKGIKDKANFNHCMVSNKQINENLSQMYELNNAQLNNYQSMGIFSFGDEGEKITYIQELLKKFNYPISIDGQFGEETLWAIRDFQSRNNIEIDGVVGAETLFKLNQDPTDKTKYKTIDNSKLAGNKEEKENFVNKNLTSETNNLITVSLKSKEVNIFSYSNKRWNLINVFKCSVGAKDTPTVTGSFKVGYKGYSFGQEKGYVCKYYTQFYGNYLFHSILYDLNGDILDDRLGQEISHGCIRLEIKSAKYIYDNIPQGTSVYVR